MTGYTYMCIHSFEDTISKHSMYACIQCMQKKVFFIHCITTYPIKTKSKLNQTDLFVHMDDIYLESEVSSSADECPHNGWQLALQTPRLCKHSESILFSFSGKIDSYKVKGNWWIALQTPYLQKDIVLVFWEYCTMLQVAICNCYQL